MTKSTMICCFVLLAFLSGCASAPTERISITPGRDIRSQPTPFLADAIDRKIERLETLLKEKRIRHEDEPLAVVIINAYQSAKSCLENGAQTPCNGVNRDLLQGLSLIDERYFSLSENTVEPKAALRPGAAPTPPEALHNAQGETPRETSPSVASVERPVRETPLGDAGGAPQKNGEKRQDGTQLGAYEQNAQPNEQGEEQHLREQIELISMREKTLSHAKELVESEKFEEAITAIDALGVEESVDEAARAILDEAVSGIVNRERNRAAKAFYSAKQTDDPARKEAYLRASHDILKQLIDKYPSSILIQKIKSNLETVNSEMAKVGVKP
jgi:hypothetical protein